MEFEITFLSDTARKIENIQEAINMAEGISCQSNQIGFDYLTDNYDEYFNQLKNRINEFRQKSFKDPKTYFANHKIYQLATAVIIKDQPKSRILIEEQGNAVINYKVGNID